MNKFKALGELTYEEKKKYWETTLSGSVIKRVITEPILLLRERWGIQDKVEIGNDPKNTQHTNDWIKAIMKRGTYFENNIIEMAIDDKVIPKAEIDKRTFQSLINKRFTANIDGFIGKDIDNIDSIVEVKYSTTKDLNTLIQRYIYQMLFYMWFFNVKNGCYFLVYQEIIEEVWFNFGGSRWKMPKGFPRLKVEFVERDKKEEKEMLEKLDIWFKALQTFDESLITWGDYKEKK